jgi:hypothetical protein
MTAKEADLEALEVVMQFCLKEEAAANNKMSKAFMRIWTRLQKVYIRTDAALNITVGNA